MISDRSGGGKVVAPKMQGKMLARGKRGQIRPPVVLDAFLTAVFFFIGSKGRSGEAGLENRTPGRFATEGEECQPVKLKPVAVFYVPKEKTVQRGTEAGREGPLPRGSCGKAEP